MAGPKIPSVARPAGMSTPIQPRWEAIIGSQTADDTPKVRMTNVVARRNITTGSALGASFFNMVRCRFRRETSGFDLSPGLSRLARGSDARR